MKSFFKAVIPWIHWLAIPLIAAIMTLWPTVSSGTRILQTDPGDTLLNAYFLEHAFSHLTSSNIFRPDLFWSPDYFWPVHNVKTWSDHLLGPSLVYGIARTLFAPLQAYTAWLIITLTLNYVSLRWACRLIAPDATPTWLSVAALLTAFSPAVTQQLGHPQLLSLYLIGPILVLCDILITKPVENFSIEKWLLLAALLLCNGFFNIYTFVYGCFGALTCISIHLARRIRLKSFAIKAGSHWKAAGFFAAVATSINFYIYIHYLKALKFFGSRDMDEIIRNLPEPLSWFTDSSQLLLGGPFHTQTLPTEWLDGVEQDLFPGWGLLICLAAAIITLPNIKSQRDRSAQLIWLLAIGLMVACTLYLKGLSAWPLISKLLPGSSSLRASSRIGQMIILFGAAPTALASCHWKLRWINAKDSLLSAGLVALSMISIWRVDYYHFSLSQWKARQVEIIDALKGAECDAFWLQQGDLHPTVNNIQAIFAQKSSQIPTLNGYSGHRPIGQNWELDNQSFQKIEQWLSRSRKARKHPWKTFKSEIKICVLNFNPSTSSYTREIRSVKITTRPKV